MLCDVKTACDSAIEILNDLLQVEKMQSGILTLNAESVPVLTFVQECMTMFKGQALDKEITMTLVNEGGGGGGDEAPLLLTDAAIFDRFKIEQCLRNLVR